MRNSSSAQHALGFFATVLILAGCASSGSQVAPISPMQQNAVRLGLNAVQPASIVYTPTNVVCAVNNDSSCNFPIDLNNDGTADFTIYVSLTGRSCGGLKGYEFGIVTVTPVQVPGVVDGAYIGWAAAVNSGDPIDKSRNFDSGSPIMTRFAFGNCNNNHVDGYWLNTGTHYLGLKFPINGKTHYGWARLKVKYSPFPLITKLTGYAYQIIAGKSIMAGQR
jgi:hypothetical protein